MLPTLFIPVSVDAYVLPRASIALAGAGLILAAGIVAGRRSLGALRLPLAAAALAAVAAALLTAAPAATLAGAYGRYESLPVRLAYLGLLAGAAWLGERRRTVAGFLLGCGVASVEALYQAVTRALPRADGNLGNANLLGALLAMALLLAIDRALAAPAAARRGWLALAALLGAGLVASTSRSAWLGAVAGMAVVAAFRVPRRMLWLVGVAGLVAAAAAAALIALTPLRALNDDTGEARLGVWHDSLSVIADRPVLGWGEDAMGLVFGRFQTSDWGPGHNFDRAHSMPLDLTATQGVVGLAACTWLVVTWWWVVWRRRREAPGAAGFAGAAAAYLVWALVNFDWAPATAAFWLLLGAGWPGRTLPLDRKGTAGAGRIRAAVAAGALLLAVGLAVPPQLADIAYYLGLPGAATALAPLQPTYWAARGDLAGLRRAAELGDPNPSTYTALGDAEAAAGNEAAARAAYRQALERYPYDATARQRLGATGSRTAASG
ncbi:MAG TPA: O-antigen ligase family protein [Candidatus Dormibacteraeota bacterium]|nr:O-antigen ligase family protein [Candidatus Dormibacteraeota bacterium]